MDIRSLQYFLAIAQEGSVSSAAERLHMTQPPLSRQLKQLEEELGSSLFCRSKEGMILTAKGELLQQYAQNIIRLTAQAEQALSADPEGLSGNIHLGAAETCGVYPLFGVMRELQKAHPHLRLHVYSGNALDVMQKLDEGSLDLGVVYEHTDITDYHYLKLPDRDSWGVLMRKDDPLSAKSAITPQDLWSQPLIVSIQSLQQKDLAGWLHRELSELNIVGTYNLLFNAGLMVRQRMGYALVIHELIRYHEDSPLCYRPLSPAVPIGLQLIWKKSALLPAPVQLFLDAVSEALSQEANP